MCTVFQMCTRAIIRQSYFSSRLAVLLTKCYRQVVSNILQILATNYLETNERSVKLMSIMSHSYLIRI